MCIQQFKQRWCDYRGVACMRNTILFHPGNLDLYPESLRHGVGEPVFTCVFNSSTADPKDESASGSDGYEMFKTQGFGGSAPVC